ncbi:MAG: hypothetical protein ACRDNR_02225, partial [Gaiellaceae bacterium]
MREDQRGERPQRPLRPVHGPLRRVGIAQVVLSERGAGSKAAKLVHELLGVLGTRAPRSVASKARQPAA